MERRTLLLLFGVAAIIIAAAVPLAWSWHQDRAWRQAQESSPWNTPVPPENRGANEDPALAASRELACIDRVLAGAIPEDVDVETALEECRRLGDAGQHPLAD